MSYFISSWVIGGIAVNGKIDDQRYYVGSGGGLHGPKTYTEVSRETFVYSTIHGWVALVTFPIGALAIATGLYIDAKERKRLRRIEMAVASTSKDKNEEA